MERITGKSLETLHYSGLPEAPVTGMRWPPPGADKTDWQNSPQNHRAQEILRLFDKFDQAYARVAPDTNLSRAGKMEATRVERDAAQKAVLDAKSWAAERARRNNAERAKLFTFPTLEPSDAVGALRDREIRDGLGTLTDVQREQLRSDMKAGKADGALHALLRDPLADLRVSPDAEYARNVWSARVNAKSGPELASLDADDALNEWLSSVAEGHQANVLDRIDHSLRIRSTA